MNKIFIYLFVGILFQLYNVQSVYTQETVNLSVEITIPEGIDISRIEATIPPLKYNKRFIFSYTFDDCPLSAYNQAFAVVNKKWVDDNAKYHYGSTKTTGYIPGKTLGYTDGCGQERRFGLGLALWPNAKNGVGVPYMESTVNLKWEDAIPMLDFGSSFYFHNVDQSKWNPQSSSEIVQGLIIDQEKTITKSGRGMKILMRPDGNDVYVDAGIAYEDIEMIGLEKSGDQYIYYPKDPNLNLHKAQQSRTFFQKSVADQASTYEIVRSAHNLENGAWIHFFSHNGDQHVLDHFLRLNEDYGKEGDDSMWFATLDEVYEYWYIRKKHTVTKSISGRKIKFDFQIPIGKYFYFTDFSLLLSGISETHGLTINTGDNVYGLSYGPNGSSLLVNINFNKHLKENADKFTAKYIQSGLQEDKDDALYFVRQLKPELQDVYRSQLGLPSVNDLENYSANIRENKYNGLFMYGSNTGYMNSNWKDEDVADILIGNSTKNIPGVGVKSLRPALYENVVEAYGYDIKVDAFKHYESLGARNNVVVIGDKPSEAHREKKQYTIGIDSESYETLYEPIWDNGENDTPINDNNDYALYVYKLVKKYGPYVKFWEIKNEPDYTSPNQVANNESGVEPNWWDRDPTPEELWNLHAPVYSYIRMLRVAYEVIKHIDPNAFVCTGGISSQSFLDVILRNTDNPDGGKVTTEYPLKGGAWFDCLSYHTYPMYNLSSFRHTDAAAEVVIDLKNSFSNLLEKYDYNGVKYPKKEFIISETNIPNKQVNDYIGSEQAQRNFQVKMAVLSQRSNIRGAYIYEPWDKQEYETNGKEYDYQGFYRPLPATPGSGELRVHESGTSWRTMTRLLDGRKYDALRSKDLNLPANIDGGAFYSSAFKNYVYVLWGKTTLDRDETALTTYVFPESDEKKLDIVHWDETKETVSNGQVSLTGTPVFVTETILVLNVVLNNSSASVDQGKTLQLTATVQPDNAFNKDVVWSSENPSIATVDKGKVTGISPGTTTVKVTTLDGNKTATCIIVVNEAEVPLSYINLSGVKPMSIGDRLQLEVIFNPTYATNKKITWTSNNESIATVDANGLVTGTGVGQVKITATPESGGSPKAKTATINVSTGTLVESVSVDPTTKLLHPGQTLQLTPSILPDNAKNKLVTWMSSDESIASVNVSGLVTAVATGEVIITVTTVNGAKTAICNIQVSDKSSLVQVWNPQNGSSDWNEETNWYPVGIPDTYTDVYIPGNASLFPTLKEGVENICRDIYFLSGAQLGQPQLLNYRNAAVQLDLGMFSGIQQTLNKEGLVSLGRDNITSEHLLKFGASNSSEKLVRNRWHMLSAPLKGLFSGDYAFGGYPFAYLRKFDVNAEAGNAFTAGRWSDYYASPVEELKPGEGFAYWINKHQLQMGYLEKGSQWYGGLSQQKPMGKDNTDVFGLGETNGILHLPYYGDSYLSSRHRNHTYNKETDESSFHYFWQSPKTASYYMQFVEGDFDSKKRQSAHRFISESVVDGKITLDGCYNAGSFKNTQGEFVLLGNPYMSAFDYEKFQEENSELIKEGYQLWIGSAFVPQDNKTQIAPMQSFLVELKETAPNNTDLIFNYHVAKLSTTNTATSLRFADTGELDNKIQILAENEFGSSAAYIIQRDEAKNEFCDWDMSKIIEYPVKNKTPEIYTLASIGGSNQMKGLVVNSISTKKQTIPLGITSTSSGLFKFTFTGMDKYQGTILFSDSKSGTIDISGRDTFEYPFPYAAQLDNAGCGIANEQRFSLTISSETTGDLHLVYNDLIAYFVDGGLYVRSFNEIIKQVSVYSILGQNVYYNDNINCTEFKIPVIFNQPGIYVLKVNTGKEIRKFKLIHR